MEETIVFPSPNWFHVSIMGASQDGWLVYGGPSKSLCFLEPLDSIGVIDSQQRFKAHIFHRAHKEKISSVDISPEWPEKRNVITGGFDGVVKEWNIEPKERGWIINYLHCQEEHSVLKEEVTGVCYGTQTIAVSVGSAGSLCKWDLNTNVVKRYSTHLKNFKPTCISSSPHKQLHVAVGTRQGVVFVIDISGVAGKLIYKIRGQDDEINRVSWCPQYAVTINKAPGKERKKKETYTAATRMDRIRNDLEPSEALEIALAERSYKEKKDENHEKQEVVEQYSTKEKKDEKKQEDAKQKEKRDEKPEEEEVIIPEDDMFDVYKDHEDNEFGHKKFEPQNVYVRVKDEVTNDFLVECEKLKAEILKKKNEPEESIESLVEAMDKAHVEDTPSEISDQASTQGSQDTQIQGSSQDAQKITEYKHLLATIGKYGGVHIWSQTGKLVASCSILFNVKRDQNKNRGPNWPTLHWFKPDTLLIADGKNQLLETNPLKLVGKDKLDWRVVHSLHRRGLFFVLSNAPRVQTPEMLSEPSDWVVWTIGQDRNLISYSMKERKKIEILTSCGAYLYSVKPCAYDAGKIALTGGDGSIRVWETNTTNELEDQLSSGVVTSYWQNVQGKVLNAVWHPTKENLLAFGTAESRVGILDAGGSGEKPAKNFPNSFKQGVYSLSWGEGMDLYACGNGELLMFRANKIDEKGHPILVEVEGQVWDVTEVLWTPHGLVVGANNGGVALLSHTDHHVITATFVFLKMIYTIAWHPQQTTCSQEESKYKNYMAVCSNDKVHTISILEFEDKGESAKQFNKVIEPLSGHEGAVLTVAWNPHRDAQLLSTSQDATVRIWNVTEGECVAIFGGHTMSVHGGMWCTQPKLEDKVLSCGGDSCLRLWDIRDYPVELFEGVRKEPPRKKKAFNRARDDRRKEKKLMKEIADEMEKTEDTVHQEDIAKPEEIDENLPSVSENVATTVELKLRGSKVFLLPITAKQISKKSMSLVRTILTKYIDEQESIDLPKILRTSAPNERGLGFLRMFGTMNDVNKLLDCEADRHLMIKDWESYLMLLFYRGRVDEMIQFASENDLLDPYLLSLSPTVSFKYWKDTTQLYLAQLDRLSAKGQEDKVAAYRFYGGPIYRKATAFLSVHNLKSCVETLMESSLFKEAYLLCRLRHMDSFAEEVLQKWAQSASESGSLMLTAILQMLRGEISEASITLGRSNQINYLKLAAQLAKLAGHNTFATYIEGIVKTKESQEPKEEELEPLPSRIEALMNADDSADDSEENSDEEITEIETVINNNSNVNGDHSAANGLAVVNGKGDENVANVATNGAKESEELILKDLK